MAKLSKEQRNKVADRKEKKWTDGTMEVYISSQCGNQKRSLQSTMYMGLAVYQYGSYKNTFYHKHHIAHTCLPEVTLSQ